MVDDWENADVDDMAKNIVKKDLKGAASTIRENDEELEESKQSLNDKKTNKTTQ